MKKRTLIVAAVLAAMTINANAQENLALNKQAYASSNETKTSQSVDGDTGTRWEPNGETGDMVNNENHFWYTVDLDEEKEFNLVKVMWENSFIKGFQILVSNDNATWTKVYEQSDKAVEAKKFATYKIGNQKARYVKIWATDLSNTTYFSFYELQVMKADASELTAVTPSALFVKTGEETDLSFTYADQYGNEMSCEGATFDVTGGTYENGKLTATADGKVTVKATYEGKTVETTVYAVGNAPELTLDKTNNVYYGIYGADALNCEYKAGWTTAWNEPSDIKTFANELNINGTPAIQVGNIHKLLLGKSNGNGGTDAWGFKNTDGYTNATVAIFPDRDVHATFTIEGGKSAEKDLKGGEWNYITVSDLKTTDTYNYFDIFADKVDGSYPNMLISNVYLYGPKHTTSELTSAMPSVVFVKNEETALTFTCFDQYNKEMADCTVSTEDGTYADGKFTPNKTGKATFTITSGDKSVQTSVYVMGENEAPVLDTKTYVYKGIYGAAPYDDYNNNVSWHTMWSQDNVLEEEFVNGNTLAKQIYNFQKTYICQKDGDNVNGKVLDLTNEDGYTALSMSVFTDRDATVTLFTEGDGTVRQEDIILKAGQWNNISASGLTPNSKITYIELELKGEQEKPNILISNICLRKTNPNAIFIDRDNISDRNFLKVEGLLSSGENLDKLQDEGLKDVTAFDLRNVTFGDDVKEIVLANKNAMIMVDGTVNENHEAVIAESAKNIESTPNLIVRRGDGFLFPISKIHLTDGYLAYTDFMVSTYNRGYEYTRNVTVENETGKWISITSPVNIATLPEGIMVYEGTEGEIEQNTLSFKRVQSIAQNTPYIAYVTSNVTLTGEEIGNLDMEATKETTIDLGNNIKFHAAYAPVNGDGKNYYGIYKDTTGNSLRLKRIGATATLGSFRAYLEIPEETKPEVLKVKLNNGIETSILNVTTTDSNASTMGIYSLDGRLVRKGNTTDGLEKGIYIVNGKKMVVK